MGTRGGSAPTLGGGGHSRPTSISFAPPDTTTTVTTSSGASDAMSTWPQQQVEMRKQRTLLIASLVLRLASLVFALLSLALVALAEDEHRLDPASSYFITYKAVRTKPSQFAVGLGTVTVLYQLLQMVLMCLASSHGCAGRSPDCSQSSTYAATLLTWIFDQLLAYLMFAACTAGATEAALHRYAQGGGCDGVWSRVCSQYEAAIGMGFLAFAALAVLALLSALKFATHVWYSIW